MAKIETLNLNQNIKVAINASLNAGEAILKIYDSEDYQTETKQDDSPLTKADKESNAVIMSFLIKTGIPIISEENRMLDYDQRKSWDSCWLVDPLDGTKEFIKKNGEFTVNIALVEKGKPVLGVIYVPATKELYYGNVTENKAFKTIVGDSFNVQSDLYIDEDQLLKNIERENQKINVVGSRSHMNELTVSYIDKLKSQFKEVEIVSKGSSLKFCLVAEGKADIYPRIAPTMEWDTAAGHAICKAMGFTVTQWETNDELTYNKENLLNPYFLVR